MHPVDSNDISFKIAGLQAFPQAEMEGYSSSLRSHSQGGSKFTLQFREYAAVPFELQRKLMEEHSKVEQVEPA